jgi:hypothetical protein
MSKRPTNWCWVRGHRYLATYIAAPQVAAGRLPPVPTAFGVDRSVITGLWPESRRGSPDVRPLWRCCVNPPSATPLGSCDPDGV